MKRRNFISSLGTLAVFSTSLAESPKYSYASTEGFLITENGDILWQNTTGEKKILVQCGDRWETDGNEVSYWNKEQGLILNENWGHRPTILTIQSLSQGSLLEKKSTEFTQSQRNHTKFSNDINLLDGTSFAFLVWNQDSLDFQFTTILSQNCKVYSEQNTPQLLDFKNTVCVDILATASHFSLILHHTGQGIISILDWNPETAKWVLGFHGNPLGTEPTLNNSAQIYLLPPVIFRNFKDVLCIFIPGEGYFLFHISRGLQKKCDLTQIGKLLHGQQISSQWTFYCPPITFRQDNYFSKELKCSDELINIYRDKIGNFQFLFRTQRQDLRTVEWIFESSSQQWIPVEKYRSQEKLENEEKIFILDSVTANLFQRICILNPKSGFAFLIPQENSEETNFLIRRDLFELNQNPRIQEFLNSSEESMRNPLILTTPIIRNRFLERRSGVISKEKYQIFLSNFSQSGEREVSSIFSFHSNGKQTGHSPLEGNTDSKNGQKAPLTQNNLSTVQSHWIFKIIDVISKNLSFFRMAFPPSLRICGPTMEVAGQAHVSLDQDVEHLNYLNLLEEYFTISDCVFRFAQYYCRFQNQAVAETIARLEYQLSNTPQTPRSETEIHNHLVRLDTRMTSRERGVRLLSDTYFKCKVQNIMFLKLFYRIFYRNKNVPYDVMCLILDFYSFKSTRLMYLSPVQKNLMRLDIEYLSTYLCELLYQGSGTVADKFFFLNEVVPETISDMGKKTSLFNLIFLNLLKKIREDIPHRSDLDEFFQNIEGKLLLDPRLTVPRKGYVVTPLKTAPDPIKILMALKITVVKGQLACFEWEYHGLDRSPVYVLELLDEKEQKILLATNGFLPSELFCEERQKETFFLSSAALSFQKHTTISPQRIFTDFGPDVLSVITEILSGA